MAVTKLGINQKHIVGSEKVMTKSYKVPKKVLEILNSFVFKTGKFATAGRRVEVFKETHKSFNCQWIVNIYSTGYTNMYNYGAGSYLTSLYFDKNWKCLNHLESTAETHYGYVRKFIQAGLYVGTSDGS